MDLQILRELLDGLDGVDDEGLRAPIFIFELQKKAHLLLLFLLL